MKTFNAGSIEIKFKNLEKSELAQDIVRERLSQIIEKFDDLAVSKIMVTLEMENSPFQAGPDVFKVKTYIKNGRYKGIMVTKSNSNLYIALAEVVDHLLEVLNRFGDKQRVKERNKARKFVKQKPGILDDGFIFAFAATD